MGQQYSAHAEGTASVSSSHHASVSSSQHSPVSFHITSSENRIKADSADAQVSIGWKNSIGTLIPSGRGESEMGEACSFKGRNEFEVSRMSIRAAIDTVIENCLSSNNDSSPQADDKFDDLQILDCSNEDTNSDLKNEFASAKTQNPDSPGDDSKKQLKTVMSKSCNQQEVSVTLNDKYSCIHVSSDEEEKLSKGSSHDVKDDSGDGKHQLPEHERKTGEIGHKVRTGEKSQENSNSTGEVTQKVPTEKQSFSAYLQERLKTIDVDKRDELTQLTMHKDLQAHEHMLMWEVTKKAPDMSESGKQLDAKSSPMVPSGPVKLQAVIDRVLDNSLRNEKQLLGNRIGDSAGGEHMQSIASSLQSCSENSPKQTLESSEKKAPGPARQTSLCFKDHIEKVLLESFLSFEEDEQREALKAECGNSQLQNVNKSNSGNSTSTTESEQLIQDNSCINSLSAGLDGLNGVQNNKPRIGDKQQNTSKDVTISVQDIVDQVINQTEMISKLLVPSSRDTSKQTPSSGQNDIVMLSGNVSPHINPGVHTQGSSQKRALVEAQRHVVQKEHLSSTSTGRKRGRPRLGTSASDKATHMPGKSGSQIVRGSQKTSHVDDRPHIIHTSHNQFVTGGAATLVMASKNLPSPVSAILPQAQHMRQKSLSPSIKNCLAGPASSGYQLTHDHHLQQHLPNHFHHQEKQIRTHDSQQMSVSNPPPPLILADKVKSSMSSSSQFKPVYHVPTQSCSCHGCRIFFSQMKQHPHVTQHHPRLHPLPKQMSTTGCDQFPSFRHSSPSFPSSTTHSNSSPFCLLPVSGSSDAPGPVVTGQNQQASPHTHRLAGLNRQRPDKAFIPRELATHQVNPRRFAQDYYHPSQSHSTKAHLNTSAYTYPASVEEKQFIYTDQSGLTEDSSCRLGTDSSPHRGVTNQPGLEVGSLNVSTCVDDDHPLDLSIKPCLTHIQDTRTSVNNDRDPARNTSGLFVKNIHLSSDPTSGGQGHYVEQEQQAPQIGHVLQRLESSVDRFLSHHHLEPHPALPSSYPYQPQPHLQRNQAENISLVQHTPSDVWPTKHPLYPQAENCNPDPSSLYHRSNIHTCQSDVNYTLQRPSSIGHNPPVAQAYCSQNAETVEGHSRYQNLLPQQNFPKGIMASQQIQADYSMQNHSSSGQNQSQFPRSVSPGAFQLPPRLTAESDKTSPHTDLAHTSPGLKTSPSPDDGHKWSAYKQEPIQNIIGNHRPSDILYLICRLCGQTYGSPYCFRKHFRNQHGFEPRADHTVVQTISATRTAMAHSGSSDASLTCTGSSDTTLAPTGSVDAILTRAGSSDVKTHNGSSNVTLAHTGKSDSIMTHRGSYNETNLDLRGRPIHSVQVEKLAYDDPSLHDPSIRSPVTNSTSTMSSQQLLNPVPTKEMKLGITKENFGMTKCLECPECGQTFQLNDFGSYKRHCRQHGLHRSSGPFACHECERSFSEPAHLQEHQATHGSFTPSVCGICQTFFSSANYLAEHIQAAHGVVSGGESRQSLVLPDQPLDSMKKSEFLTDMSKLKRSSSFPDWSMTGSPVLQCQSLRASESSDAILPSPSGRSTTPMTEPHVMSKSVLAASSSGSLGHHILPIPKRHRHSQVAEGARMLTFHTPKGLEVQKLPADAVVITASPDSSYDEGKLFLETIPSGSTSQKDRQEIIKGGNSQGESNSQEQDNRGNNNIKPTSVNENISSARCDNKYETESSCSERCASVESGSLSLSSSQAPSPAANEGEIYYKHKKYHRKRTYISEHGHEPSTKSSKLDGGNFSVSSTGNSTVQDCVSSSVRLEDSIKSCNSQQTL